MVTVYWGLCVIKKCLTLKIQWGSEIWLFKIWNILNPDLWNIGFQMVLFLKDQAIAKVLAIWKLDHWKFRHFCPFKWFATNVQPIVQISNGRASHFRSHSKLGPLAHRPLLDHSKSGRVWISDLHHCVYETRKLCNIWPF